eukprot:GHVP01046810.1.p1 GENE.GHVP01046810.1~~GHVP01046810.1.p1  ORF type:complete len:167 (+),score=20.17 GHVP01046810.1:186-686(+)
MSRFSVGCIFLLTTIFDVKFVRPHSCPPWTEERYLVCTWPPPSTRDKSVLIPVFIENLETALKKIDEASEGDCLMEIVSPVTIIPTANFYEWLQESNQKLEYQSLQDLDNRTSYRLRLVEPKKGVTKPETVVGVTNQSSGNRLSQSIFQSPAFQEYVSSFRLHNKT